MRANKFANFVLISVALFYFIALVYDLDKIMSFSSLYKLCLLFAGIVICFFVLRLRQDYKVNLVITGLSILIGMSLIEIYLFHISGEHKQRMIQAQKMEIPFDSRSILEVSQELHDQGIDAFPFFHPASIFSTNDLEVRGKKIIPLGGVSHKSTVLCNETGEWIIYQSDEHGFNNPTGLFEVKDIDIILVGDSFTHGTCVRQGEDIASQLRKMSGLQIINLGMGGNGPLLELASLKEYAEPLKPKHLLWIYYEENDLIDLMREQKSSFFLKYLDNKFSLNLINSQPEIDSILIEYRERTKNKLTIVNYVKIVKFWYLRQRLGLTASAKPTPSLVTDFVEVLKSAKSLTSSWNGQLYFVYLPAWHRYAQDVEHGTLFYRNQILSAVQSLDIPIIDIHDKVFSTHPDPMSLFPFRSYGHYTSEGYRLVAQTIQASLKNFERENTKHVTSQ